MIYAAKQKLNPKRKKIRQFYSEWNKLIGDGSVIKSELLFAFNQSVEQRNVRVIICMTKFMEFNCEQFIWCVKGFYLVNLEVFLFFSPLCLSPVEPLDIILSTIKTSYES